MPKFIFTIPGRPVVYGARRGDFIYVEAYHAFVYKAKPVGEEQFNDVFKEVFRHYREEEPEVRLVPDPKLTPEELVKDAVATLRHFEPELLRPQIGRPPKSLNAKPVSTPAESAPVSG